MAPQQDNLAKVNILISLVVKSIATLMRLETDNNSEWLGLLRKHTFLINELVAQLTILQSGSQLSSSIRSSINKIYIDNEMLLKKISLQRDEIREQIQKISRLKQTLSAYRSPMEEIEDAERANTAYPKL